MNARYQAFVPLLGPALVLAPIRSALRQRKADLTERLMDLVAEAGLQTLCDPLSLESIDRIARSPLLPALLASEMTLAERQEILRGWLMAERMRVSTAPRRQPSWTALGDLFLATQPDADLFAGSAAGVVVDGRSPLALELPFLPEIQRVGTAPVGNITSACAALQDALEFLFTVDAATGAFTTSALTAIIVYETPGKPNSFSSSSSRSFAGAAMVSNVIAPQVDRYKLADALLHEAVHAYLYAVEQQAPLVDHAHRFEPWTVSPWTGTRLPLHAFTHACFVWLTLLRFWSQAAPYNRASGGRVAQFQSRAARGFMGQDLTQALSVTSSAIPKAAGEALLQVHAAALQWLGSDGTGSVMARGRERASAG